LKVKLTKKDFTDAVLKDIRRAQMAYVLQGGQMIQGEMKVRAAKRTGNLQNSVQTEAFVEDGVPTSETGPTADYAEYVEYGTGIYATNGNGRKTPWFYVDDNGVGHFTHGMEAQPFAEPGYQAALARLPALAERLFSL
jgi:HK97 gp10 family phage protein